MHWNTPLLDRSRNGRAGRRQHREVRKSSMFRSNTYVSESAEWDRYTVTLKTLLVHHNQSFQGISTTVLVFYWFSTTCISRSWKGVSKTQGLSSILKDCANFVRSCHGIYMLHSYFIQYFYYEQRKFSSSQIFYYEQPSSFYLSVHHRFLLWAVQVQFITNFYFEQHKFSSSQIFTISSASSVHHRSSHTCTDSFPACCNCSCLHTHSFPVCCIAFVG